MEPPKDKIISVSAIGIDRALKQGLTLFDDGQYDEALTIFDEAIARFGSDMGLYHWKGVTLRHMGRLKEAIRALELSATESTTGSLFELALLLLEENVDSERGINLLEGLSANHDLPAREYLAHRAYEEGRFADVVTLSRASVSDDAREEWPDCVDCLETLEGIALTEMGYLEEARFHLKRAARRNPGCASHMTNLGRIYQIEKRHARALQCYMRAVELDPEDPIPQVNLAHLYEEMGRVEAAHALFRSLYIAGDPQHPDPAVLEDYARFLARRGELDQAVQLVERALQQTDATNGDDLAAFLGWLALDSGDNQRARAVWENLVEQHPAAFAARHYLAGLCAQNDEKERALSLLEEAAALDSNGTRSWCVRPDGQLESCFEPLKDEPRFKAVAGLAKKSSPKSD